MAGNLRRTEAKAFFGELGRNSFKSDEFVACVGYFELTPTTFACAANERTFLHWMNMSVTTGSISAALLGKSADSTTI
jgi:hypothetical protein